MGGNAYTETSGISPGAVIATVTGGEVATTLTEDESRKLAEDIGRSVLEGLKAAGYKIVK